MDIIYEYEECLEFSNKKGNELYIVSADYLKKINNGLDEIKDKKVIIKKIKKGVECEEENSNEKRIQFAENKDGFYSLVGEFNPISVVTGNYKYFIIYK